MRSRIPLAAVLVLALSLAGPPARAHDDHDLDFRPKVDDKQDVITCSDIEMNFWKNGRHMDDIVTARRDQSVSLSAPRSGPLHLVASIRGGVWVQPSSNGTLSAVVCTAAGAETKDAANALLDQLRIVNEGGELRVRGPLGDWSSYLIVSVPSGVSVDMEGENGALYVRGVSGTFSMRTTNGPIQVARVSGKVVAHATNGPIGFIGHEGDIDLEAVNGPISVNLNDPAWSGKGLDANTRNGPISVFTPDVLKTGVQVAASQHSPWSWNGHGNINNSENWATDRTVVIGKGPVLVRVSTWNGPVSIMSHAAPVSVGGKSRI